jgi:O-antigen/teichoic acid export membrane protein
MYKGKYVETAHLLPYLAIVPFIFALTSGWLTGLRILGKNLYVFFTDSLGAALTLTLGVFFVHSMGLTGAVIGIVLGMSGRLIVLPWLWASATNSNRHI